MTTVLMAAFIGAALAPLLGRVLYTRPKIYGWLMALLPAAIFAYLLAISPDQLPLHTTRSWVPSLGINLTFHLDGLSRLMGLLISGIGALIFVYAGGYMAGSRRIGELIGYLLLFMGAMLGLVLSANLLTIFIFWELTSISSYLLIGFNHQEEAARQSALKALVVTGGGGLVLLAGFLLIGVAAGSYDMATLLANPEILRQSDLYLPILLLIVVGAATKSAQVPFHFWLPDAMSAPTPVSAYLHSATMVKAGIYLLARLFPLLGGTPQWVGLVTTLGAVTMLVGAFLSWQQHDLKRILAYSTLSVLGTITMLLGMGTPPALEAAFLFLLAHAMYKGSLFMVAGAIDVCVGTRDLRRLGGLLRVMPLLGLAAMMAALSKAGLPPTLGFIGKEALYAATLAPIWIWVLTVAAIIANGMVGAAAILAGVLPFVKRQPATMPSFQEIKKVSLSLVLGPMVLAVGGLWLGLRPDFASELVGSAAAALTGEAAALHLALWHGWTLELGLSGLTIAVAVGVWLGRDPLSHLAARLHVERWGPAALYERFMALFLRFAAWLTLFLQHGNLRWYLNVIIGVAVALMALPMVRQGLPAIQLPTGAVRFSVVVLALMMVAATVVAVRNPSRLAAIASLSVIGFAIAVLYILFSAPDLAMTQFSVETLSVILIVLIIAKLPRYTSGKISAPDKATDVVIAVSTGVMMTLLVLFAVSAELPPELAAYFAENSYLAANGHNVVNVILVDFRGLDTMGEITVLSVAGLGVFMLSRLRMRSQEAPHTSTSSVAGTSTDEAQVEGHDG